MDFSEKAKIRLDHWISHNEHHREDYVQFAEELEKQGMKISAQYVREMITLTDKNTACLKNALKALDSRANRN